MSFAAPHTNLWFRAWHLLGRAGMGVDWTDDELERRLGGRPNRPDRASLVSLLLEYYRDATWGERRCAKEGFVHRQSGHVSDATDVLADILFAAPELGTIATAERGGFLVLRTCDRTVGVPMRECATGRTVRLQTVLHAVNAALAPTAERRRFLPLFMVDDTVGYVLVDLEGGTLLQAMGVLAAPPPALGRFACWRSQPSPHWQRRGSLAGSESCVVAREGRCEA